MAIDTVDEGDLCRLFGEQDTSHVDTKNGASRHDDRFMTSATVKCLHCDTENIELLVVSLCGRVLDVDCTQCGGLTSFCLDDVTPTVKGDGECWPRGDEVMSSESSLASYMQCDICYNDDDELFFKVCDDTGHLVLLQCLVCETDLCLPSPDTWKFDPSSIGCHRSAPVDKVEHSLSRKRILDLGELHLGDHVAFHRNYLVWHHAIVIEASPSTSELTMIHYNGAPKKLDGKLISVRLETELVDAADQELYRYEYKDCFEPQEVVERAISRLGEARYAPWRNCEHFARWCKTGEERCFQVDTVKQRLISTGVSTLGKQVEEGVVSAARYMCKEAPEEIFKCGTGSGSYLTAIHERAVSLFSEGTSQMGSGMKWGALAGNMAVNLIIETVNFGIDISSEFTRYRQGKISWGDLRQQAAKTGCECLGGFLGSTGGGLILQLLIPIPFIGGFIGCALGNIFGRLIGAGIGKQLHKVT